MTQPGRRANINALAGADYADSAFFRMKLVISAIGSSGFGVRS
jgi:hypothetical protein